MTKLLCTLAGMMALLGIAAGPRGWSATPPPSPRQGHGHNQHWDRDDAQDDDDRDEDGDHDRDADHDRDHRHDREGRRSGRSVQVRVEIIFHRHDREVISDYFRERDDRLPPGLAKRGGNLPPGLQKHLQRNGQLPPGLQKRVRPFPDDLDRRLPPLPTGYKRATVDGDAVIIELRTHRVVDVLRAVIVR